MKALDKPRAEAYYPGMSTDRRYGIWSPKKGAFLRTRDRSRIASYSTLLEASTILRELGPAWAGCYVADCTEWAR